MSQRPEGDRSVAQRKVKKKKNTWRQTAFGAMVDNMSAGQIQQLYNSFMLLDGALPLLHARAQNVLRGARRPACSQTQQTTLHGKRACGSRL